MYRQKQWLPHQHETAMLKSVILPTPKPMNTPSAVSQRSDVLLTTYADRPPDILLEDKKIFTLARNAASN